MGNRYYDLSDAELEALVTELENEWLADELLFGPSDPEVIERLKRLEAEAYELQRGCP